MNYIIKEGHLYTCDQYGNTGTHIQDKVLFADYNATLEKYLVTKFDGTVWLTDKNGNTRGSHWTNCNEARFMGNNEVRVVFKNGKTIVTDMSGNIKRTLN